MNVLKCVLGLSLVATLVACGGGGGSSGTASSGSGTGTGTGTSPNVPVETLLSLQLKDKTGATTQSIAASGGTELVATLTTKAGLPVSDKIVIFVDAIGTPLFVYPGSNSAKTDSNGVARVKINRASLTKFGSGTLSALFSGTTCDVCTIANVGYSSTSSSSLNFRADPPAFKLELRDSANQPTNSISSSGFTSVRATLKFDDGTPVAQKRVDITGDLAKVAFPEGNSQLTDSQGLAEVKVARASLTINGAGTLNVTATISGTDSTGVVDNTVVTSVLDYQVGQANIALTKLNLGTTGLPAYGNRPISVVATINGLAASSSPVQVTFNASCGTVTPATVSTDSVGTATTTYSASLATCAGTTVTVSASAVGATSVSGPIAVASPIATNVQFITTTPQLIYLRDSVGTTQAQVAFKVVDSSGNALPNNKLRLSLSNAATGLSLDTVGNTAPVDLTTDSLGLVSVKVFSGTVPTSVNIKATLLDSANAATGIFSSSNLLTVASGQPTQRSLSLAASKLSIEGLTLDGETTSLTLSMADRQGNPVPPGTQVNFVTESGVLLPAVCFVPPVIPATASSPAIPTSACTVTLRSQGTRPANGRVSILAYVAGEEDFVDANGNNVYDPGELFTDLGRAYRDDNSKTTVPGDFRGLPIVVTNGQYDAGEFQQPRAGTGACVPGVGCAGDGVWGAADVRQQATVVFATSVAKIVGSFGAGAINLTITDSNPNNSNSVPSGSTVIATAIDQTPDNKLTCSIAGDNSVKILNTLEANITSFGFKECSLGDAINIKVTTPLGTVTSVTFAIQ